VFKSEKPIKVLMLTDDSTQSQNIQNFISTSVEMEVRLLSEIPAIVQWDIVFVKVSDVLDRLGLSKRLKKSFSEVCVLPGDYNPANDGKIVDNTVRNFRFDHPKTLIQNSESTPL